MYGRGGLDRFKKAQTLEPFSVTANSASKTPTQPASKPTAHPSLQYSVTSNQQPQFQQQPRVAPKFAVPDATVTPTTPVTQVGGGQSTWQPPDWAIEPRAGFYYLEVLKDGEVLDHINLDKRRHIFGRQIHTCDFVLDHQSVSRQHAAVVPHKNGSVYVIDLGSAHGTFVANERLSKDSPVELEVGQSLRFAASTRTYILRKNEAVLFPPPPPPSEIKLPPPPDPSDEEAVVAYNTIVNRYGLNISGSNSKSSQSGGSAEQKGTNNDPERAAKRRKRSKVVFRDQVGGELVEVVGMSDGADVETEPGPIGVEGGSLAGKYESLVKITVIPKGKEETSKSDNNGSQAGMTDKLREVLNKVKSVPKGGGIYDDLFGESVVDKVGSSWASGVSDATSSKSFQEKVEAAKKSDTSNKAEDDDDDLFGD
uniref:FHA domain-containing protein n=1 Tax=Kalanchoe fedtschenkoi TaxID=63787 RepID=A0A7N0ZZY8_KALFE